MFNLFCNFCAELLEVTDLKAQCLGCKAQYALKLDEAGCVREFRVLKCGGECGCT